jgi:hypothetical protein
LSRPRINFFEEFFEETPLGRTTENDAIVTLRSSLQKRMSNTAGSFAASRGEQAKVTARRRR